MNTCNTEVFLLKQTKTARQCIHKNNRSQTSYKRLYIYQVKCLMDPHAKASGLQHMPVLPALPGPPHPLLSQVFPICCSPSFHCWGPVSSPFIQSCKSTAKFSSCLDICLTAGIILHATFQFIFITFIIYCFYT